MSVLICLGFAAMFALALLERYRPGSLVGGREAAGAARSTRAGARSNRQPVANRADRRC